MSAPRIKASRSKLGPIQFSSLALPKHSAERSHRPTSSPTTKRKPAAADGRLQSARTTGRRMAGKIPADRHAGRVDGSVVGLRREYRTGGRPGIRRRRTDSYFGSHGRANAGSGHDGRYADGYAGSRRRVGADADADTHRRIASSYAHQRAAADSNAGPGANAGAEAWWEIGAGNPRMACGLGHRSWEEGFPW